MIGIAQGTVVFEGTPEELDDRALEAQVQQKELLLKEVNHRIKNSLQIVSSILSLQVSDVDGTEAASAIRNAAARRHRRRVMTLTSG